MSADLLRRILDALLREDHLGLCSQGRLHGTWWSARLTTGVVVRLPVRPDGFLSDWAVAEPLLLADGIPVSTVDGVLAAFAPHADPEAERGWAEFTAECAHAEWDTLATPPSPRLPAAAGYTGLVHHEAVAALREHPVHPTGRVRHGMSLDELRRYAPEHLPSVRLKWITVRRDEVRLSAALADELPPWWPRPSGDTFALPVHPLTAARAGWSTVDGPEAYPTLSMRTLALAGDPSTHVKVPMPTATLGARNRRSIKPGVLPDGEAVHRLLDAVRAEEPELAARVLLADESRWVESDDDMRAALVRVYPAGLAADALTPAAALPAPDPYRDARVIDRLATDVRGFVDEYLCALFDWHVALWLRYGIALESHQQNITIAVSPSGRIRLVYKDNDGAKVDLAHATGALGAVPHFHDRRILAGDPREIADLFTTITLHLCVAAPIIELAGADRRLRAELFGLARTRLREAVDRWHDPTDRASRAAEKALREHVLDADRLPVKGMLTAGTLLPKHRLGIADVNKYYLRTGPNYLRTGAQ
ncbi:siderophore synthetase component [Herbihabitans rhizosphaerae]|uniref:Siderophore synthetase component n=1 Tax=Herbihabitans rhizosphaerae TaxID=1872711 RepID=A0A4Q7KW99_9PSEU|nr:IucA/IucC family protein [Herbihabitans rhizosphaerae]RZS40856.1 siderophore synthetase component [Herbihabitans rhizosphaerae]